VSAVLKIGETTRTAGRAETSAGRVDLTGKTLKVKIKAGNNLLILTSGAGAGLSPQLGDTLGKYWFDVTPANLTALGEPVQVSVTLNIFNADNTLLTWGSAVMDVVL
jgi:hypothetical protein